MVYISFHWESGIAEMNINSELVKMNRCTNINMLQNQVPQTAIHFCIERFISDCIVDFYLQFETSNLNNSQG